MRSARRRLGCDIPLALAVGLSALGAAAFSGSMMGPADRPPRDQGPWAGSWDAGEHPGAQTVDLPWLLVPVLVVLVGALAFRRFRPRTAFVVTAVAVAAYLALGLPYGPVLVAPALAVHAMAAALPPRPWVPWTALLVPMLMVGYADQPYVGLLNPQLYGGLVLGLAVSVFPAMFGMLRRARREAERRERDVELAQVVAEERLRVAREVHDVVGHSLSVISMQAGVALHVLEKRPDQVGPSLELRTTLDLFRDAGPDITRAPLPGLARLDDLVGELRSVGRTVTVIEDLDPYRAGPAAPDGGGSDHLRPEPLSATVDQAAYRIVQEALTNVVRHAGNAAVTVLVRRSPSALVVEVADDGGRLGRTVPREGHGIAGMRERARALGGVLSAGPRTGGGFVVHAELPVLAPGDVARP